MGFYNVNTPDFFSSFDGEFANSLFYSRLRQFELTTYDTLLSVKVAISGPEEYCIDGNHIEIPEGHYCIINPRAKVDTLLDSEQVVEGISIFLDRSLVNEAVRSHSSSTTEIEPEDLKSTDQPWFRERIAPLGADPIGCLLGSMVNSVKIGRFNNEFFLPLIDAMVLGQHKYWRQMARIPAIKASTRVELQRRLELGRNLMVELQWPEENVSQIARRCCLTTYNFIRFFKAVYRETPYQFLLRQKIERAQQLLVDEPDRSIGYVAVSLGFADHSTFGKRFKAMTGLTPNDFRKKYQ